MPAAAHLPAAEQYKPGTHSADSVHAAFSTVEPAGWQLWLVGSQVSPLRQSAILWQAMPTPAPAPAPASEIVPGLDEGPPQPESAKTRTVAAEKNVCE
jgi:hypothetical protein